MAVKITIQGERLIYDSETTILKASQIIAFLNAESEEITNLHAGRRTTPLLQMSPNKSPRDALIDSDARTNMQKILVFAGYHLAKTGEKTFNPQEIKMYFRKAGETEPSNYSRDIREAIALNYIYEENPGEFVITNLGNELLDSGFKDTVAKTVKRKSGQIKKTSKSKTIRLSEEISSLEILPKMNGLIDYHKIEKKGDRILWILNYAKHNSIEALSPLDIEFIASKLVDNIPAKNLSALTERSRKVAFLTKNSDGKFKILFDGIEHVKNLNNSINREGHIQADEGK